VESLHTVTDGKWHIQIHARQLVKCGNCYVCNVHLINLLICLSKNWKPCHIPSMAVSLISQKRTTFGLL